MRRLNSLFFAALVVIAMSSCTCSGNRQSEASQTVRDEDEVASPMTAMNQYLAGTIAKGYASGEVSIPFSDYVAIDEANPEDILVWGDFWVDSYNVSGDTLLCVSGGNHPGKMHVRKESDGTFHVTSFEEVGDGSTFLPTAKEIFGERFEDFQAARSNDTKRAEIRKNAIAGYVFKNTLPVTLYKDYGWPAVEIPKISSASLESVSFEVVKNYFFRNDAQVPSSPKISSQEQFDSLFGAAAFMGKDGQPTAIHFDRQFVIAVMLPETDIETMLEPLFLTRTDDNLVFTYWKKEGDQVSYTMRPVLLVAVDKAHETEAVVLNCE